MFPLPSLVLATWDPWPYLPPHSCRPQSHHIATRIWCFNHRVWLTLVLSVTRIQKPVPDRSQISLSGTTASEVWLASLVGTPSQDPPPQDSCWETQAPWLRQCFLRTWVEHQGQLQFFLQFGADRSGSTLTLYLGITPDLQCKKVGRIAPSSPSPPQHDSQLYRDIKGTRAAEMACGLNKGIQLRAPPLLPHHQLA